jgi:biotin carboxyl carrier protein
MRKLDFELVRHALSVAREHGFREVEMGVGSDHFHAKMEPAAYPMPMITEEIPEAPSAKALQSTAVGYYSPGTTNLEVGERIAKGDNIAAIEVLGLANDVEAKLGGVVVEVRVKPGDPVEYGQVLAMVQPE